MDQQKRKYRFKNLCENSLNALIQANEERKTEVKKKWEEIKIKNKNLCKICHLEKPLQDFSRINQNRNLSYDTWSSECKKCERLRKRKEKVHAIESKGLEYNISTIFKEIQRRSEKYKREFDIDVSFLIDLYKKQNGICPYTGIQMSFDINTYERMSLDRIDSNLGYVKNNVVWSCWIANNMKQNMTIEQMKHWVSCIQKTINSG